jgi:hypothetical protein
MEGLAVLNKAFHIPGRDSTSQDALDGSAIVFGESSVMWMPRTLSTAVLLMWIGACSILCFLKSTINSFVLLALRERLLS